MGAFQGVAWRWRMPRGGASQESNCRRRICSICAVWQGIRTRLGSDEGRDSGGSQPRHGGIPVFEGDSFQTVELDERADLPCDAKSSYIRDENGTRCPATVGFVTVIVTGRGHSQSSEVSQNGSILGARTLKQPLGEVLPLAQALDIAR